MHSLESLLVGRTLAAVVVKLYLIFLDLDDFPDWTAPATTYTGGRMTTMLMQQAVYRLLYYATRVAIVDFTSRTRVKSGMGMLNSFRQTLALTDCLSFKQENRQVNVIKSLFNSRGLAAKTTKKLL